MLAQDQRGAKVCLLNSSSSDLQLAAATKLPKDLGFILF